MCDTEVINTTLQSVIRPLSRLPCTALINTHSQREAAQIEEQNSQILYQCSYNVAAGREYLCCSHWDAPAINQSERETRHSCTSCGGMLMRMLKRCSKNDREEETSTWDLRYSKKNVTKNKCSHFVKVNMLLRHACLSMLLFLMSEC